MIVHDKHFEKIKRVLALQNALKDYKSANATTPTAWQGKCMQVLKQAIAKERQVSYLF